MQTVSCPRCRRALQFRDDLMGCDCQCPACGIIFRPADLLRLVDLSRRRPVLPFEHGPRSEPTQERSLHSDLDRLVARVRRCRRDGHETTEPVQPPTNLPPPAPRVAPAPATAIICLDENPS